MNFTKYIVLILFALSGVVYPQTTLEISGTVSDENENPLPFVNVYIENSLDGAMTDENGRFKFFYKIDEEAVLIASMVGYNTERITIHDAEARQKIEFEISLLPSSVELDQVVVMGSAFSNEKEKGIVISSMEVMMTPGGAADIFQSLKTMPGLTSVSESAELYVRGGDPSETVTMIDQASIYHPYTYESSYGGLFSNLNTAAVNGMYFSSGGFSPKYGNVLSGVLDISTKNEPASRKFDIGISMAAAQLNAEIPIIPQKLGVRIYGMQSFTKPIMWLNGTLDEFTTTPVSGNITTVISGKYSESGRLKFTGIFAADKQGVSVERAEYSGAFNGNSSTSFYNLQLSDILMSNTVVKSSLSLSKFENRWKLGVLDLTRNDETIKFRTDIESTVSNRFKIDYGFEFEFRTEKYLGRLPDYDYDIRPGAESTVIDAALTGERTGGYLEFTLNNILGVQDLHLIGGIRTDRFSGLGIQTFDPRAGLVYNLGSKSKLRLAWGVFHQLPEARLFVPEDGNPELSSMRADHFVLSYDYESGKQNLLRFELFNKQYSGLPLNDPKVNYSNDGFGFARGADFVWKGTFPFELNGWISYGFITTKRKWMDFESLTSSSFDISHNLSVILKYAVNSMWHVGLNFKYATGRPFTPIIESNFINAGGIYEPVYGLTNSDRYPDYKRVDARITHLNQLFGKYFTVIYLEAINILDINNLFGYTYTPDYTSRRRINSYFGRRTIVLGMSVTI